jgi:hypothetical protein
MFGFLKDSETMMGEWESAGTSSLVYTDVPAQENGRGRYLKSDIKGRNSRPMILDF